MARYAVFFSMINAASYHRRLHLQLQLQYELTSLPLRPRGLSSIWSSLRLIILMPTLGTF